MKKSSRFTLGIILATILIDMIGFGIVIPVLPLYAEGGYFRATPTQLGWLVGIFSLMQLIMAPVIGTLSDRIGRKPVLFCSVICTAIGFFIMGAATQLWMLFLARIIAGASGGNIAAAQACIADITSTEERSKAMGLLGAIFGLGFVLGPALGGALSAHVSISAPYYFAAGLAFCNVVFIGLCLPETLSIENRTHSMKRTPLSEVFTSGQGFLISTILAAYLVSIMGFSMMTTLFALFNEKRFGYGVDQTGYLLAYVGILGILVQGGLLRRLLQKPIEQQLARIGSLLLALGFVLFPFCKGMGTLIIVIPVIALGNGFVLPTLNGLASRCSSSLVQGRVIGLMQSAGSLGRFIGPLIAMTLVKWDAPSHYGRAPFWGAAVFSLIAYCLISAFPKEKIRLA